MEYVHTVDSLTDDQRARVEELLGHKLGTGQTLILRVVEGEPEESPADAPSLPEWFNVLEGLSEEELADFDRIVSQRANLTRTFE